jgi:stearoyl-CoA 9-desaturase NADPH oxidoreductase
MHMPIQSPVASRSWLKDLGREFSRAMVNSPDPGSYFEPLIQAFLPSWTALGHRAQVVGLRDEKPQVFTLQLKPLGAWPGFQAGQFVELSLDLNGRRLTRCFSISSSPSHFAQTGQIELTIRIKPQGRITPMLYSDLLRDQVLEISKAKGDFVLANGQNRLLYIAGGSGITPFRSMLQELSQSQNTANAMLLYYCSNEGDHLFSKEFDRLAAAYPHLKVVRIVTRQQGRFHADHLAEYCADYRQRDVYLCGPAGLIQSARSILKDAGVPRTQIHVEHFGPAPVDREGLQAKGRVLLNGSSKTLETSDEESGSILAMAEQHGLRPQSGCRMGLCGQCRCTKTSGVVYNTRTGLYSDTGKERIQICVSVPVGDVAIEL